MKRILSILLCLAVCCAAFAQKAVRGMRAPRIEGVEWLSDRPSTKGKAQMVVFFHSSNPVCVKLIEPHNALAGRESSRLNIVVVAREPAEQISALMLHQYQYCYIAIDEAGKIFKAYDVPYVPYAVIVDRRGEILWTGNPSSLTDKEIEKFIAE